MTRDPRRTQVLARIVRERARQIVGQESRAGHGDPQTSSHLPAASLPGELALLPEVLYVPRLVV